MTAIAKHHAAMTHFREHPGEAFDEAEYDKNAKKVVSLAVEQWQDVQPEIEKIIAQHWQEIALDQDVIKLDPDWAEYQRLDTAGRLHLITARDQGWLVGYHIAIIHSHLHYKSSLQCFSDVFYLLPEYRRGLTGYRLLKLFRDCMKQRGVQKVFITTKKKLDLEPLFLRLGFHQVEKVFALVFR